MLLSEADKSLSKYDLVVKCRTQPCTDCKVYKFDDMSFDHLPEFEKMFEISSWLLYPKWALHLELAKCEIVCNECHKKRENGRARERKINTWGNAKNASIAADCAATFNKLFQLLRFLTYGVDNEHAYSAVSALFRIQRAFFEGPKQYGLSRRVKKAKKKRRHWDKFKSMKAVLRSSYSQQNPGKLPELSTPQQNPGKLQELSTPE